MLCSYYYYFYNYYYYWPPLPPPLDSKRLGLSSSIQTHEKNILELEEVLSGGSIRGIAPELIVCMGDTLTHLQVVVVELVVVVVVLSVTRGY